MFCLSLVLPRYKDSGLYSLRHSFKKCFPATEKILFTFAEVPNPNTLRTILRRLEEHHKDSVVTIVSVVVERKNFSLRKTASRASVLAGQKRRRANDLEKVSGG